MGKQQGRPPYLLNRKDHHTTPSSGWNGVYLLMVGIIVLLAVLLLSNQKKVNHRAAEVESTQRNIVLIIDEIHQLAEQEQGRANTLLEQERLARERLHWTIPGEYILKVGNP
jgi:hypothetical protein